MYSVIYQDELVADNMADLDQLLSDKPNLSPLTRVTILNGAAGIGKIEVYRYQYNGQTWGLTSPDPTIMAWATTAGADIATLQSQMAAKAAQTQVTSVSNALDQLNASFQNFQPLWASILNKPNFHAVATSGSYADLSNKPTIPTITTGAAIVNSATNAPTDAKTDYGLLAAILGADVNATNAKQNATATNVNALAVKFNTLLTTLRTNGIIGP